MQMTWWYLTYFDITDHNDIDIGYDLTKQHLSQFLSWWRRVFFYRTFVVSVPLHDFCNSLPIFARLCTFLDFLKWRGFQRLQAYCKPTRAAFKLNLCKQRSHATCESDLGLTESCWTWCSLYRLLSNESCFANQFPEDQGALVARSRKHLHKKSLFLSLCLNRLEQYGVALCLSKAVDLDRWTDWRPTRSNWFVLPTSASLSQQIESQDKDGIALAKIWSSKSLDWFELRLCLQALTRCFVECDDHTVMKHAYTAQKGSKRPDGFKYSVYDSLIDLTETNELCPNGCFVAFAHACWLSICSATVVGGHLSWLINL